MSGYVLSPYVEEDIFDIWRAIAEDSESAADHVENEFRRAFANLGLFPGLGHWRGDIAEGFRFWPVWDYLIVYRPVPSPVLVIAVLHGRRNPDRLAQLLSARLLRQ